MVTGTSRSLQCALLLLLPSLAYAQFELEEVWEAPLFFMIMLFFDAIILACMLCFCKAVIVVNHSEVIIKERFGKYTETLRPGCHWMWPLIEDPRAVNWRYLDAKNNSSVAKVVSIVTDHIDTREHIIDFGRQTVITRDTVQIVIDALVYFRVSDPRLSIFSIQNLPDAVELLTQATLRNIIAKMTLDETFSSRDKINADLLLAVRPDAERWGVTVTRVEIFNIDPPRDIRQAMEQQIRSERERRSAVLEADGNRLKTIIESEGKAAEMVILSEGQRAADILLAEGKAKAKMMMADAQASALKSLSSALKFAGDKTRAVDYLNAIQYMNSLNNMTNRSSTVVMVPKSVVDKMGHVAPSSSLGRL